MSNEVSSYRWKLKFSENNQRGHPTLRFGEYLVGKTLFAQEIRTEMVKKTYRFLR